MATLYAPQIEGVKADNSAITTDFSVALPTGIVAGELLLAFISGGNNVDSFGSGWTELWNHSGRAAAWRAATGSDALNVTMAGSNTVYSYVYRISGAQDPTVQPPEVSTGASGSDAYPNPDSITPTGGTKDYLFIAYTGYDDDTTVTSGPSGYTNFYERNGGNAFIGYAAIALATLAKITSTEDPGTFAINSSESWYAFTVAVPPIVVGPANISKINGVAKASISKLNGVSIGAISKINGVE